MIFVFFYCTIILSIIFLVSYFLYFINQENFCDKIIWLNILFPIFVAVVVGIIVVVRRCRKNKINKAGGKIFEVKVTGEVLEVDDKPDDETNLTTAEQLHEYESIDYYSPGKKPEYFEIESSMKPPEVSESLPDISKRPQQPLPPEEREEDKPYLHYDTPYDWRIFRFGVKTAAEKPPNRGRQIKKTEVV